ncbi:MAG: serine/threonine-protein kinase, partial [Aggregatilineales bacterium]
METIPVSSSQQPSSSFTPGSRYHPLGELGKGGMGVVYRAEDRLTGEIVALKRMHLPEINLSASWTSANEPGRVSLAREFQTLATMRHPNIINVLDYGFDLEEQPYFTMTLLENARDILRYSEDKRLTEKINLIIQVLQALIYLHQRSIIHRDLKPGNILVTADGQVQVLDFGLAIEMSDVRDMAGSLAYMAPEILKEEPATPVSDLYSVGVLIYIMLVGRHPFGDAIQQMHRMVNAVATETPDTRPVSEVAGEDMAYIVATLLEKDPSECYQSAGD